MTNHLQTLAEVEIPTASGFTGHTWTVGTNPTAVDRAPGIAQTLPGLGQARPDQVAQRYQVLRHLGSGGMGDLYLARTRDSRRLVAIKRMRTHLANRTKIVKMFRDEAQLAARINHPNVVRVVDLKTGQDDEPYFAMEYVAGKTLADLVRRVRPPLIICAGIVAEVAAGLHAVHDLRDDDGHAIGAVHQDVSPQNIIIGYDGGVKLIDFGVARTRETTACFNVSAIRGKLPYMAPEQLLAQKIDRRTDIFALGIVLYEITTMTRLFKARDEVEIRRRVLNAPITPPSELVARYPEQLERIVLRALRRDPRQRYQTAAEMVDDLQAFLGPRGRTIASAISSVMSQVFSNRRVRRQLESPKVHHLCAIGDETRTMAPATAIHHRSSIDDARNSEHDRLLALLAD